MSESRQLWLDVVKMHISGGCSPEACVEFTNHIVDAYEGRFHDRPCPPELCDEECDKNDTATPAYREVDGSDVGGMIEVRIGLEYTWHDRMFVGFNADYGSNQGRFCCKSIYNDTEIHCWPEARVRVW
jgi:hypothetical protein